MNIRGSMCREGSGRKGDPITTDYEGELDIKQLSELNLLWFSCSDGDCDSGNLEIISDLEYKCKKCGNIGKIPYL